MYPIGSVLIGIGAAGPLSEMISLYPIIILWLVYFSFPSNIFMYGINDMADTDTDKNNNKKGTYEVKIKEDENKLIIISIIITHILFLPIIFTSSPLIIKLFLIYLLVNILYSLPPIRLKRIPILDSISNGVICAAVGSIGYVIAGGTELMFFAMLAGGLWSVAMHIFSAIPDIKADKDSGIQTIATLLGKKWSLYTCLFIYLFISLIFVSNFYIYHSLLLIPYIILIIISLVKERRNKSIFTVYKTFPYVTYIIGYLVYLFTVLSKG